MPKLGELKRGRVIGYKNDWNHYIWHACVDCGKERWVPLYRGKPRALRCRQCGSKFAGQHHQQGGSAQWKGGRFETSDGYIVIRLYPNDLYYRLANSHHYVMEHRLIMAKYLGRVLYRYETVHHKNGIKNDNRFENLELRVSRHPSGQRVEDLLKFAHWVIDCYGKGWKKSGIPCDECNKTGYVDK